MCGRKCVLKHRAASATPPAARKATRGAHAGLRGGRSVRRARGPVAGRIMLFMAVARARLVQLAPINPLAAARDG